MNNFRLTNKAKTDLISIARYTQSKWGKQQRNIYLQSIDQIFHKISSNPNLGQNCDYVCEGYKKYPLGQHLIFYKQETAGEILISRILHKQMDAKEQLKQNL